MKSRFASKQKLQKLYAYVDETGQDTEGRFFLVSVIISNKTSREGIEARLEQTETNTKKHPTNC